MRVRTHSGPCENSPNPASECRCSCRGRLHGISLDRLDDAPVVPDVPRVSFQRCEPTSSAQIVQRTVTGWILDNWDNPRGALPEEAAEALAGQVSRAVDHAGRPWRLSSRFRGRHGVCGLLALTAASLGSGRRGQRCHRPSHGADDRAPSDRVQGPPAAPTDPTLRRRVGAHHVGWAYRSHSGCTPGRAASRRGVLPGAEASPVRVAHLRRATLT